MNDNPLGTSQRERAGSGTFARYEYQYHWALCRIIEEHSEKREYAIFMELHEDVVLADSLNCNIAKFEFNQIKCLDSGNLTIRGLTKRKGGKGSILGKLVSSVNGKPFASQVTTINLVATCGFKLELADSKQKLDLIKLGDLSAESCEELRGAIEKELGIKVLPSNLQFKIPNFDVKSQQDTVIGRLATLISAIFPGSHCDARNIYRALIDELHRKGAVEYDFSMWEDLLRHKALTSQKVNEAISTHTTIKDMEKIRSSTSDLGKELGLSFFELRDLKRRIESIHVRAFGFPTALDLRVRSAIKTLVKEVEFENKHSIGELISRVESKISDEIKGCIGEYEDVRARIIYEIIAEAE